MALQKYKIRNFNHKMQQLKVESTTAIVQPRFSMHQTKDDTDLI
jgi:hypothetical protein